MVPWFIVRAIRAVSHIYIREQIAEIKVRSKFKPYWAAMTARGTLKRSGLWRDRRTRPPPKTLSPPQKPVKYPFLEQPPKALGNCQFLALRYEVDKKIKIPMS